MWIYEKKLEYPVKIVNPNPRMAKYIITQYGGPDGELNLSHVQITPSILNTLFILHLAEQNNERFNGILR